MNKQGSGSENRPQDKKPGGGGHRDISPAEVPNLGLNMALRIIGSFYIGRRLDLWLGTSPWLMLILFLLGVGAAYKALFDFAKK